MSATGKPTERELEQLHHEQRLIRELIRDPVTRRSVKDRCIYCGQPSFGRACKAHKELLVAEQMHERGQV